MLWSLQRTPESTEISMSRIFDQDMLSFIVYIRSQVLTVDHLLNGSLRATTNTKMQRNTTGRR
jgi:hypothetical protein